MNWYVYILRCSDNSLYTGVTWNIEKRVREHNFSKIGAKSIKGKLPAVLVYSEIFTIKTDAFKREREIKGWKKERKETLINNALVLREAKDLR